MVPARLGDEGSDGFGWKADITLQAFAKQLEDLRLPMNSSDIEHGRRMPSERVLASFIADTASLAHDRELPMKASGHCWIPG